MSGKNQGILKLMISGNPMESLDPCCIEALILVPKKSPPRLTGNASQLSAFSCSEIENSLTELDQVNKDGG